MDVSRYGGKVTVGVGLMLPDSKSAGALPFTVGDRQATAEEIAADFHRVSALPKGRTAAFYHKPGGLRLAEETIDERLREVLEGFEGYLRAHIAGYPRLPDAAKLALLDMVYNLGPGRLFQEYPKLIGAIERGDWADAAKASLRRGPSAARNTWTKEQFLDAARQIAIKAAAEVEQDVAGRLGSLWRIWMPIAVGAAAALLAVFARQNGSRARSVGASGDSVRAD